MRPGQTRVYALPSTTFKSSELQLRLAAQLDLRPGPPRPAKPARAVVLVSTSDDECFPCPKALLKPCIALTKAVRDPADEVHASVPVDCSTFDRVLLYLEASARGQADSFALDANSLEAVAEAALANSHPNPHPDPNRNPNPNPDPSPDPNPDPNPNPNLLVVHEVGDVVVGVEGGVLRL